MKKVLFLVFISLNFSLFSQTEDSVYHNLFSDVSEYRNYNEVYLGNLGTAKFNLLSPFRENDKRLKSLFPASGKSSLYTDIFFVTGSGKENYLDVEHYQNLGKSLKMNLFLTKTSSEGTYQIQETSLSDYNLDLDYSSSKKRYNFNFKANYYRRYNELNGGINDSIFNDFLDSNITLKTLYPIQFTSGFAFNKMISKEVDYTYSHSYKLSKNANDSVGYFKLNQKLGYQKRIFEFNTSNPGFFDSIFYYDTTNTLDSLREEHITHEISLSHTKNNQEISIGFFIDYIEYNSYSPFYAHVENSLFGRYNNTFGNLELQSKIGFMFEKSSFATYFFNNSVRYKNKARKVFQLFKGEFNVYSKKYDTYYERYKSNHYQWNQVRNIDNIVSLKLNAISNNLNFKVGVNFESHDNSIIFDTNINVIQSKVTFLSFNLKKAFNLTSWLHWDVNVHFQDILSRVQIETPNFVTSNRIYFKGKILKNDILKFNIGFNVLYYTSFYAKAYSPALDKFYLQNHTKVGNYPYLDFFAEFYLKNNFAFFTSITHFNSGLFGNNYLATTNYPSQDRAFKFGMKWRLFE